MNTDPSPQPNIAVFGYGSLVNNESLQQTIGRHPSDIHYVNLQGWIRDWSVAVANNSLKGRYVHAHTDTLPDHVLALNIQRDPKSAFGVNGILFAVSEKDLRNLDNREFCYERVDITKDILGQHPFDIVYTYTGLSEYLVSEQHQAVIPKSYQDVVCEGFRGIDELAYKWYVQSTAPTQYSIEPTRYLLD